MSYLTEAFKALDALNEDTFSVSDDGIKKLAEFEDNDDLVDEITVYDADAEDTEDLEDSYVGKVIVDCNVCHSKIYKDKSDVVIDEETQNANIDEECPYCYSTDGFKVIGEVAPMTTETEEKVKVEDELEESLNEATERIPSPWNTYLEISDYTPDAESGEYQIGDTVEGNTILAYLDPKKRYEDIIDTFTMLFRSEDGRTFVGTTVGDRIRPLHVEDFDGLENVYTVTTDNSAISLKEARNLVKHAKNYIRRYVDKLDSINLSSSGVNITGSEGIMHILYRLNRDRKDIAYVRVDVVKDGKTVENGYPTNETELINNINKGLITIEPSIDIFPGLKESLSEATDLSKKENTIAGVLSKHMDELSKYTDANSMRNAIIDILDKSDIADKDAVKKFKRVLFSKKSTGALLSTIATYMTGEKVAKVGKPMKEDITEKTIDELEDFINETKRRFPGSEAIYDGDTNTIKITLDEKTINEDLGNDIDEYQQWVDYDMKRYGKISDQTNKEIKEAGLQVVKDKYGDYQVIAGKYDESVTVSRKRRLKESFEFDYSQKVTEPFNWESDDQEVMIDALSEEGFYAESDSRGAGEGTVYYYDSETEDEVYSQDLQDEYSHMRDLWDKAIKNNKTFYELKKDVADYYYDILSDIRRDYLDESVKDVTITTDDSKTTMTSEDDGKVTVTTEPVEQHKDDEVIEPLTDETEAEIAANDGEEDVDIEDFDEDSFDELGEGYFKKVYENVNSFKTSNVSTKDNKVVVEGVVTFDNNVKKNTKFIFESVSKKNDKYRMIGENVNITKGNKAFSLMGSIKDKKFLSESLNYNYRTKNDIGKSTRCLGTVRRG